MDGFLKIMRSVPFTLNLSLSFPVFTLCLNDCRLLVQVLKFALLEANEIIRPRQAAEGGFLLRYSDVYGRNLPDILRIVIYGPVRAEFAGTAHIYPAFLCKFLV